MARVWLMLSFVLTCATAAFAQDILRGHGGPVRALAVRADTRELISGSFDTAVIVWDLERNTAKRVLRFHDGPVNAVSTVVDGCIVSAGEDRRIAAWCPGSDTARHTLTGHDGPVTALVPAGHGFASAGQDGTVRLWALGNAAEHRRLAGFRAPVTAMIGLAQQTLVLATADGRLRRLRWGDGLADVEEIQSLELTAPVNALAVATGDDGRRLAVAASADARVRLFDENLQQLGEIEVDATPLFSLAVSPDGRLIATAGLRGGIAIIDRASRTIIHRLTGPGLPVWSLAFDTDNRTLFSGGADRVIRRWDAVAGKPITSNLPERDVVAEAAAGAERGAQVFRACQACHTLSPDGGNRAGPTLAGIFGRRIGTVPGYTYSDGFGRRDIVWSKDTIARLFEIGPAAYTPGTKMPEQTITSTADRQALVEWLERVTATR